MTDCPIMSGTTALVVKVRQRYTATNGVSFHKTNNTALKAHRLAVMDLCSTYKCMK